MSKLVEFFRKARGAKIFEIFGAGDATKIFGGFRSCGLSTRNNFPCDLFLSLLAWLLGGTHRF